MNHPLAPPPINFLEASLYLHSHPRRRRKVDSTLKITFVQSTNEPSRLSLSGCLCPCESSGGSIIEASSNPLVLRRCLYLRVERHVDSVASVLSGHGATSTIGRGGDFHCQ